MNSEKILIIEDEENILEAVKYTLTQEGYDVFTSVDGEEGLEKAQEIKPDLVLLDVMLPKMDGFEVCRILRKDLQMPVFIISAKAEEIDRVVGLEIGADDYLTKPFAPKELSARIRALLRRARSSDSGTSRIQINGLVVIPEEGVVLVDEREIHLTRTEFRLLVELASNPGRVLSREDLLQRVWDYDYFGDGRLVDVHVRRLRTKVEVDPAEPRYIITMRGMGYKLQPE